MDFVLAGNNLAADSNAVLAAAGLNDVGVHTRGDRHDLAAVHEPILCGSQAAVHA